MHIIGLERVVQSEGGEGERLPDIYLDVGSYLNLVPLLLYLFVIFTCCASSTVDALSLCRCSETYFSENIPLHNI